MRPPRFSIGSLLTLIAIFAVGLAALRSPSPLWASTTYTVAAVAIVAGVSNAILGRGARRAYWIGFALFGGVYFHFTFSSNQFLTETALDLLYPHVTQQLPQPPPGPLVPPSPPQFDSGASGSLVVYSPQQGSGGPTIAPPTPVLYPTAQPGVSAWDYWMKPDRYIGEDLLTPMEFTAKFSSVSFRKIGHSLAALLAATLGGIFVRWRYEENSKEIGPAEAAPGPGQPETAHTLSA